MGEKAKTREMMSRMVGQLREGYGMSQARAEQVARNCALRHDGAKPADWRGSGDVMDRPRDKGRG